MLRVGRSHRRRVREAAAIIDWLRVAEEICMRACMSTHPIVRACHSKFMLQTVDMFKKFCDHASDEVAAGCELLLLARHVQTAQLGPASWPLKVLCELLQAWP